MVDEIDVTLPLSSYSYEFKTVVSKLDPKKILSTDGPTKILRDWRGLAYLLNIPNELSLGISEAPDKTVKVLEIWVQRNDGTATLEKLLEYLGKMDRYDIADDLLELARLGKIITPIRHVSHDLVPLNCSQDENMIITHDDRRDGRPNYYHAYVLFAQEDWSFVRELLARMKDANFKLCTEYDIELGYGTQYAPVAQLILERCYRIILVYSPDFLQSPANNFYSNYAQAVGIESNKRNIIPIVYRQCQLPHNLMYYHKLVYNHNNEWMPYDFWLKLKQTLDKVKLPNSYPAPPSDELDSTDMKNYFLTTDSGLHTSGLQSRSVGNLDTMEFNLSDLNNTTLSTISHSSENTKKKKRKAFSKMLRFLSGNSKNKV